VIKILVVDDEPGLCQMLEMTFAGIGFTVLTATNGADALSLVESQKPGIVVLDVRMFGMSGLEVLREIKRIDNSIKVIMLTVVNDENTIRQARDLGADEFIAKPFRSEYLQEVIAAKIGELVKEGRSHGATEDTGRG
jgi:two-component system, response regulator, stage 0 sporulation protein F